MQQIGHFKGRWPGRARVSSRAAATEIQGEQLGLVGPKVNSGGAEERRTLRVIRTLENLERFPGDCEILESGGLDDRFELCFQQAAGNSPGP